MLKREGIVISMDGRGRAFDNIFVERLWRSVKHEDVYLKGYATMGELTLGLASYFAFYNGERHRTLNKTPYAGGKREIDGSFSILCNEYPDAPSDLEMDLDELDDEPASPVYLDSDVEEALCEL